MSWRRLAGPALALVLAGAAAASSACSATATTATTAPTSTSAAASSPGSAAVTTTTAAPPETRAPGESEGAFVFRTECAGCHGPHGEGNLGPSLAGIAGRMSEAAQLALVRGGRDRMPPFAPGLSESDIEAVVAYTRTQLG
jgi:mono/diheme cytochrome c family protein